MPFAMLMLGIFIGLVFGFMAGILFSAPRW